MQDKTRQQIIDQSWDIHGLVEAAYLAHPAKHGDTEWQEKQRLLLADMALHLLQTALDPNDIALDKLRNNLHAILSISDGFLPQAELSQARDKLYDN